MGKILGTNSISLERNEINIIAGNFLNIVYKTKHKCRHRGWWPRRAAMVAMYLLRRPEYYQVELYERRPDFRGAITSEDGTFPIGLKSTRGLAAIRAGVPGLE